MHAQSIAAILAVAGSAFGGTLPSYSSTSTVTLYSPTTTESTTTAESKCTVCAHPKDYDRNWNADTVINDTRKHHQSFKLFAYNKEASTQAQQFRIPLHLQSKADKGSGDLWGLKLAVAPDNEHNNVQPRWNLHDKSLETDGSAPINDTLYFHLYDGKYPKDTEFWTGTVYHDVSTPHKGHKKYKKEKNAKLVAEKSWSLVRDHDNPLAYILKGSKPKGEFFACLDLTPIVGAAASAPGVDDKQNFGEVLADNDMKDEQSFGEVLADNDAKAGLSLLTKSELVYSASDLKEPFVLGKKKGCVPLIIKAEDWTNPK